ncbi:hypothetical protein JYU34_021925 [Plutella xylostella]|uniref:FP protein C-terminal domain-containing protein n=1 Tax=Plutella xylostella TaxID=51655 RepID=A0ABQ7PRQ7_PLUXY|nr:hypothetical protein JYU34_021925 [Plutella xylostella]
MNKSLSETDITTMDKNYCETPTTSTFVSTRIKRKREEEDLTMEFSKFKEEIKELISSLTIPQENELKKIAPTLSEIQKSNRNIENSIAFLTAQNEEYKKSIQKLETQAQEDRKYISLLEEKVEDLQKGMRKASFEIKNVPKVKNETKQDLIEMVTTLSNNIGCTLSRNDVKDIYRVRGKKEGMSNTPIIVETSSTLLKNDILTMSKTFNAKHKAKLCAKHLGLRTSEDTPIFITENLTAKSARLHFLGRDLVKSKLYKFCWTSYGKVYIRKDENSPVIMLQNEMQIQQLFNVN